MIRKRNDVITIDYQMANGDTRVIRYRACDWQLAMSAAEADWYYHLATPLVAGSVMNAINRQAMEGEERRRPSVLERLVALFYGSP